MDTFPAKVTKYTNVSEVAMVNCAYQCPYAQYGYPCYHGFNLTQFLGLLLLQNGNLGRNVTMEVIGNHSCHRKFGNIG